MLKEYTGRPLCYHAELIEILAYTADLLKKHGITFWLDGGNLLGAVRNGKIIPWDWDADICTFEADNWQIINLSSEIKADGYHFKSVDRRHGRPHVFKVFKSNQAFHLDIFPFFSDGDKLLNINYPNEPILLADVCCLDEIKFECKTYPCPHNAEKFVRRKYGENCIEQRTAYVGNINHIKLHDPTNTEILDFISKLEAKQ